MGVCFFLKKCEGSKVSADGGGSACLLIGPTALALHGWVGGFAVGKITKIL